MSPSMPCVHVLIKPVSGNCNMSCTYCFYKDEMSVRNISSYGKMSEETLEQVIKKTMMYKTKEYTFSFQGGEPTLAGLSFFQKALELEKKYNTHHDVLYHSIQTNGYALTKEWAAFFKKNHFLVGISLDGMPRLHDTNRIDSTQKGTFSQVMSSIKLLETYQVEYNILTVVTEQTAQSAEKIYHFFKKNHLLYQQYIPCLDPLNCPRGQNLYSLSLKGYEHFLKTLFDCWYLDMVTNDYVYIRYFENLAGLLKGYPPEHCGMGGICGNQWVIEADGSVYPCDFYVLDQWKIGNIWNTTLEEMNEKRKQLGFVEISTKIAAECKKCRWYPLCRNGCQREREPVLDDPSTYKNYYCEAYKNFFSYAIERFQELL